MSQGADGAGDASFKGRDASPGSGDDAAAELGDVKDKPRESKSKVKGKVIRVLTVLAYVLSVSLAAIMLSLYYVFLWDPKMPSGGSAEMGRLQADGNAELAEALQANGLQQLDVNASDASTTVITGQSSERCA